MAREFTVVVIELLRIKLFEGMCCSVMDGVAAITQERFVSDLLRQSMLETIFDLGNRWLLINKFAELKLTEHLLQVIGGSECNALYQLHRKLMT